MNAGPDRGTIHRKLIWRITIPLAVLVFVNAIDRVNISFAAQAMGADIGLDAQSFGLGVSVFFLAYLIFQYPHAALLRKWGVRLWLSSAVTLWGLAGVGMASVTSPSGFYVVRFFLGMAEAGLVPAMTFYIGQWIPVASRGRAMSILLSAIPLSLMLGGPICGLMLDVGNPFGMSAWRWMFVLQSVPNFVLAVFAYVNFSDAPEQARWLTTPEKEYLKAELGDGAPVHAPPRASAIPLDSRTWLCAMLWLLVMTGSYALIFWMPQLVRQMAIAHGEFEIGLISAVPQTGIVAGMLFNGWHSDRSRERLMHFGVAATGAGLTLLAAGLCNPGWGLLALLTLAGIGIGGAQGVFWTIPSAVGIGGGVVPVGALAFISMSGTLGGVIGPAMTGSIVQRIGSFGPAITVLALMLIATILPLTRLRHSRPIG